MPDHDATVLVVDDEREIADIYAGWLEDEYRVVVAYSGEEALDALDETIDVVLLDRRIPDVHGDELLEHIREGDLSCWVAMVTAVEPQFDILDMGFDDYLVKPATSEGLRETVAMLVAREAYDTALRDYFAAVSKWAVLVAEHTTEELDNSPKFQELESTIEQQREELDELLSELTDADFRAVLRDAVDEIGGSFDGF